MRLQRGLAGISLPADVTGIVTWERHRGLRSLYWKIGDVREVCWMRGIADGSVGSCGWIGICVGVGWAETWLAKR